MWGIRSTKNLEEEMSGGGGGGGGGGGSGILSKLDAILNALDLKVQLKIHYQTSGVHFIKL